MSIWFQKNIGLEEADKFSENTMAHFLGLKWKEIGEDYIKMSMPVDARTKQPYGFLHGGASCVLAETAGSVASAMVIDMDRYFCVGLEINANHLRSVSEGEVVATCRPLHLGRSTHVWDIKIHNDKGELTCVSRLTVAVRKKEGSPRV